MSRRTRRQPTDEARVVEVVGLGGLGDVIARDEDGSTWWLQGPDPTRPDPGDARQQAWLAALPGARVQIRPIDAAKRRAEVISVEAPSSWTPTSDCAVVGRCGGCAWRHVPRALALREKRRRVERLFGRHGARHGVEVELQAPEPDDLAARRRRVRLHARRDDGGELVVGFHARRSDAVVSADRCPAITPELDALRGWLAETLQPWCLRGSLHAVQGQEGVVLAIDARSGPGASAPSAATLLTSAPSTLRLVGVRLRAPGAETRAGRERVTLTETAEGGEGVSCDARGFAQATAWGNRAIRAAVDRALSAERTARGGAMFRHGRELYAGSGNLTAVALRHGDQWTTVEQDAGAVQRARQSGRAGVRVVHADVDAHIAGLVAQRRLSATTPADDLWLLDPARPGARVACEQAAILQPGAVVYVSCAPETLRRDVDALTRSGLRLASLVAIDAFPHTPHVELVAHLDRAR